MSHIKPFIYSVFAVTHLFLNVVANIIIFIYRPFKSQKQSTLQLIKKTDQMSSRCNKQKVKHAE